MYSELITREKDQRDEHAKHGTEGQNYKNKYTPKHRVRLTRRGNSRKVIRESKKNTISTHIRNTEQQQKRQAQHETQNFQRHRTTKRSHQETHKTIATNVLARRKSQKQTQIRYTVFIKQTSKRTKNISQPMQQTESNTNLRERHKTDTQTITQDSNTSQVETQVK